MNTPWTEQRPVEQDLIVSRAVVEIFSEGMLRDGLQFAVVHVPTLICADQACSSG